METFITILVCNSLNARNEYIEDIDTQREPLLVIDYSNLQLKNYRHFNTTTLQKRLGDNNYNEIILTGNFVNNNYIEELIGKFKNLGFKRFNIVIFQADKNNISLDRLEDLRIPIIFHQELDEDDTEYDDEYEDSDWEEDDQVEPDDE